jgi:hypothetical protein
VLVPAQSTFSATFNGETYTAAGAFPIRVGPGTYQISGSFRGVGMGVAFANTALGSGGGVQSGSVRSLAGPDAMVEACRVIYVPGAPASAASTEYTFRVQFTMTTNVGSTCQG